MSSGAFDSNFFMVIVLHVGKGADPQTRVCNMQEDLLSAILWLIEKMSQQIAKYCNSFSMKM